MLRDCDSSNVWEISFIAVNMHPLHRIPFNDWLDKISSFVNAAAKYGDEVINLSELLPKTWLEVPLAKRQGWIKLIKSHKESWDVDLLMALRKDGMGLMHLSQIYKLYHAEQHIAANFATPPNPVRSNATTPRAPKKSLKDKARMLYHLWKVPGTDMTPTQQLDHAITVRNRSLGPDAGTTVSQYLDVEISADNEAMLKLNPADLNMFKVLQSCNVKHGERRRVARRALTMMGTASGMSGFLNGPEQLKDIRSCLEFADSLEQMKHAEKMQKKAAALVKKKKKEDVKKKRIVREETRRKKNEATYRQVLTKLDLVAGAKVLQSHVDLLTVNQCKAVAFCQCDGQTVAGLVKDVRIALKHLLPDDLGVPDYPTQDEMWFDNVARDEDAAPDTTHATADSDADTHPTIEIICDIEQMNVGDCLEVYWEGEDSWFEGEVMAVDMDDRTFRVHYHSDGKKIWHKDEDFKCRFAC